MIPLISCKNSHHLPYKWIHININPEWSNLFSLFLDKRDLYVYCECHGGLALLYQKNKYVDVLVFKEHTYFIDIHNKISVDIDQRMNKWFLRSQKNDWRVEICRFLDERLMEKRDPHLAVIVSIALTGSIFLRPRDMTGRINYRLISIWDAGLFSKAKKWQDSTLTFRRRKSFYIAEVRRAPTGLSPEASNDCDLIKKKAIVVSKKKKKKEFNDFLFCVLFS
jgi:hypothetical protein